MEVDVQVGDEIVTVEAPDNATDEQIIAAVRDQSAPKSVAPRERTDLEAATNVVQSIRHGAPQEPGVGRDALQLASAPFRGIRGLTIGAGRALAGEGLEPSLNRAAEAIKPGFKPETPAEKLATASSGLLEVVAPLGQASRATRIGRGLTELATLKGTAEKIAKLKQATGVVTDLAVEPIRGAKQAATFVNSLTNLRKAKALKALGPQELHNVEVQLRNLLDAEKVGKFARLFGKKPKGLLTDQAVKLATENKAAVVKAQNEITKGLEGARRTYGDIAARNRLVKRAAILGAAEVGRRTIGSPASSVVTEVAR
jgi:hypothetical protein